MMVPPICTSPNQEPSPSKRGPFSENKLEYKFLCCFQSMCQSRIGRLLKFVEAVGAAFKVFKLHRVRVLAPERHTHMKWRVRGEGGAMRSSAPTGV